jgi:hypothetical protein
MLLWMEDPHKPASPKRKTLTPWLLPLLLPYAGLLFPALYARSTPTLFGFPFFYWYQFAWVLLASIIMAVVYLKTRD